MRLILAAGLALLAMSVNATVIDFEEVSNGTVTGDLVTNGFVVSVPSILHPEIAPDAFISAGGIGTYTDVYGENATQALGVNAYCEGGGAFFFGPCTGAADPVSILITEATGTAFSFQGLSWIGNSEYGNAGSMLLIGHLVGGGTVTDVDYYYDPTTEQQFVGFGGTGNLNGQLLTSLELVFDGGESGRSFVVDDIKLVAQSTVVPVPAAIWLFGSALAGLGWMRRKQTV
jgi:hypothetical protein